MFDHLTTINASLFHELKYLKYKLTLDNQQISTNVQIFIIKQSPVN